MSDTKRSRGRKDAKVAEHAERSRAAMQRASSVHPLRKSSAEAPKGRKGRKGVVIYLTPEAKDQLARLAFDQRMTVQDLGVEAINLLFEAYRQKPIA